MSEPTKITGVHIKLKSIDLIDELLNAVAGTEDDGELSAVEVLTEIKRLIIQDWLPSTHEIGHYIRNGGASQADIPPDPVDLRTPESLDIETARNNLIAEMAEHGFHAEDAAAQVDGLICVCQRDAIPRAKVQAAVDRLAAAAYLPDCECPTCDALRDMCVDLGVEPSEVAP